MVHLSDLRGLLSALVVLACVGCGSTPAPRPAQLDVLQHVYMRGATPQVSTVALTIDGLGRCTPAILDALSGPAAQPRRFVATFFVDPEEWSTIHADDARRPTLARLAKDGHAVALGPRVVPTGWRQSPTTMRQGLRAMSATLRGWAGSVGVTPLRAWRPRDTVDFRVLGRAADAERPVILWSLHADHAAYGPRGQTHEALVARLGDRLAAQEIVALPGDERVDANQSCPTARALDALATPMRAKGLTPVTVDALLGPRYDRHSPPRLVRFRGPGRPAQCVLPGLPADRPTARVMRWGLVIDQAGPALRVLAVGTDRHTAATLQDPAIRAAWRDRAAWQGRPGCLRRVRMTQLETPITAEGPRGRVRWWSRTGAGVERRDPRFVESTGQAVVLPTRADLVRIEARQRLPWSLRGVVAGALERLGLDAPLLLEARSGAGIVFARPVPVGADAATILAAVGGVVQIVELTVGEYLFLAQRDAPAAERLRTAARAADGFVRAGPFLVLPSDGVPDLTRVGPDGRAALAGVVELTQAILRSGQALRPGDVISDGMPAVIGPPAAAAPPGVFSRRARLRHALARSILEGLSEPAYLRPGAVVTVDGDLLGQQTVRVAVAPGMSVPSPFVKPLVQPRAPGEP